jgi:hypothetical protein
VSKFLGKFRKNKDYNDEYDFSDRNRNERSKMKKIKNRNYDEILKMCEEDNYYGDYAKSSRKNSRRTA